MRTNKLKRLLQFTCQTPIYLSSFIIKRNPDLWVFGSWNGQLYNDNSKYLFEFIINEKKDINAIWITKNKKLLKKLKSNGKPALYCYSLKGIYIQLRAGACFFTQSHRLDLLGAAVAKEALLFQLWHGMPLKKILNDDVLYKSKTNNVVKVTLEKLFPWTADKWDRVISPSIGSEDIFASAFGGNTKIINSGFPRNKKIQDISLSSDRLNEKISNIIYMPTFRGSPKSSESNKLIEKYLQKNGFDFQLINEYCIKNNQNFYIKLHPSNDFSESVKRQINLLSNIYLLDSNFDFYEEAHKFDLLITDYSSVFFDFILSKRPILHVAFDINDYIKNSRELYFNYDSIRVGPNFKDWVDVFNYINILNYEEVINSPNYKKIYSMMRPGINDTCEVIYNEARESLK